VGAANRNLKPMDTIGSAEKFDGSLEKEERNGLLSEKSLDGCLLYVLSIRLSGPRFVLMF
jgi:hypothetical protein